MAQPLVHKQCIDLLKNRAMQNIKISHRKDGFICTFKHNSVLFIWGDRNGHIKYMSDLPNWCRLIYRHIDVTTNIKLVP